MKMNSKTRFVAIAAAATIAFAAQGETETVDGYTWTYRIVDGNAEIYNDGNCAVSPEPDGEVTIPPMLGGKSVTSIGDSAFYGCVSLTDISIPESVEAIGRYAFYGCDGLASNGFTIVRGILFEYIGDEADIALPPSVRTIGESAFYNNGTITNVTIPNSVTVVESSAFRDCTSLENMVVPGSVEAIGWGAFYGCSSLTNVTISSGVKSIGLYAFSDCVALMKIDIPDSVTDIGGGAFRGCDSLIGFTVSSDNQSFRVSNGLLCNKDVTKVVACPASMTNVTIPNSVQEIGDEAFAGGMLSEITMPEGLSSIGWSAFNGCDNLTGIEIPEGVTYINMYCFAGCENLSSILLPVSVTAIGAGAFYGCALQEITIPRNVQNIEWSAFANCTNLVSASLPNTLGGNLDGSIFEGCSPDLEITYYEVPLTPARVFCLNATEDGPGIILVSWNGFRVYENGSSWTGQNDADGFKVYRGTKPNFEEAALVAETGSPYGSPSPYYCDKNVSVGSTNYYWVAATNQCGEGEISGPVIGYCEEPLVIETISLSDAMELVEYETQLSANGDADYLRWRIEEAYDKYGDPIVTLPEGFSVSEDGVVSGVALYAGEYAFTVSCRDRRFPDAAAEVKALVTLTVNENPNRKPVISGTTPVIGRDVVLEAGTSQRFDITASDPEGDNLTYKWFVDDEEVQSGEMAWYRLRTDAEIAGTNHVVTCYVNDDLWTNVVKCTWNVYVPKVIHINSEEVSLSDTIWEESTPYDTIHVPSGRYWSYGIPHPLTIIADDGPTNTVIKGRVSLDEYNWRTPGKVTLRGFTLTGKIGPMSYESVYSNLSLERCIIESGGIDRDNWREDEYEETGNEETVRGLFVNCSLDRCTVANNCVDPEILPLMTNCVCSGTIVWGNEGAENDAQDPVFVSLSNGDYRLRASSPYVADGVVSRGALDDVVSGHVISASVVGPGSLDKMVATLEDGGSATFSVVAGSHPFDHFEVNGESVVVAGNSYTFSSVVSDATLTAFFVSNITFYVDVTNGNDSADGFTKATAVATLQVAIDRAVNGDTILVADGVYAPIGTRNRRIVIESENGYKNAIIDGGSTNVCAWLGGVELGPGEPPVYTLDNWTGNKTTLRGFTLRNGSGRCGAGAIGGTLESCLIVGNEVDPYPMASASPSGYGGGAYNSVLYNCTVTGNSSMPEFDEYGCKWGGLGGGTWGCSLYGCIEWGNFDDPEDSESYHYSIGSASLYDEFCCLEDPLFVDAANGDYRLLSGSPCVVNGIVTAGCETEIVSGIMPELTSEQVAAWVSEDLATRYAKSGESVTDYQNRFKAKFGTDYAAAMARQTDKKDTLGNPMYVWQDYVAGTDPTDTNSVFTAQIEMVDGVPQISWSPELPSEQAALRTYTIYGKTNLTDRAWHSPTNSASRFFRVGVKLR